MTSRNKAAAYGKLGYPESVDDEGSSKREGRGWWHQSHRVRGWKFRKWSDSPQREPISENCSERVDSDLDIDDVFAGIHLKRMIFKIWEYEADILSSVCALIGSKQNIYLWRKHFLSMGGNSARSCISWSSWYYALTDPAYLMANIFTVANIITFDSKWKHILICMHVMVVCSSHVPLCLVRIFYKIVIRTSMLYGSKFFSSQKSRSCLM